MPTQAKTEMIEVVAEKLKNASIAVLVTTEGLGAKDTVDLRKKMRAAGVDLQVTKNTLLRIAAERNELTIDPGLFQKQTTVAFGAGDEVAAAKAVFDYVSGSKVVTIKSGILGGRALTAKEVEGIAKLKGGKLQAKAEAVGTIQGPAANLVGLFNAPLRELAYTIHARAEQLGGNTAE